MARKAAQGRRQKSIKSLLPDTSVGELKQEIGGYNYKNLARKLRATPFLINAGVGVGAFFLVRYAIRYFKSHPEIMEFLRDNLDTVEGKIREYRGGVSRDMSEDEITDARH